jgi:hypothetical protein
MVQSVNVPHVSQLNIYAEQAAFEPSGLPQDKSSGMPDPRRSTTVNTMHTQHTIKE